MSRFSVKGWCPDAWRPMMSGDGLLVRVKPRLGRLTRVQVLGLCDAAVAHGNGLIDVTRRANLQIRGVGEDDWPALLEKLVTLALVDPDATMETRRNILVTPDWQAGGDSHRIASDLLDRLGELPVLPGKVGFVVDTGPARRLADEPGDFRIERDADGGLILRAEGHGDGCALAPGREVDGLIALARWFVESGGAAAGRMVRHQAALPAGLLGVIRPASSTGTITPGPVASGAAYGVPFGRVHGQVLTRAIEASGATALRVTPWRVIVFESTDFGEYEGLIGDAADPLLRADACPGAPDCPQATVETRELARRLAPCVTGHLHVSGCDKGCARSRAADVEVTGRDGFYHLAVSAIAGSSTIHHELGRAAVLAHFGAA